MMSKDRAESFYCLLCDSLCLELAGHCRGCGSQCLPRSRAIASKIVQDFHAKRLWGYDPVQHAEYEQAIAAAIREAETAARAELLPWKDAIEEAMMLYEMAPMKYETTRECLHRLICWEKKAALDQAVSSDAAALVARARAEAFEEAARIAEGYASTSGALGFLAGETIARSIRAAAKKEG